MTDRNQSARAEWKAAFFVLLAAAIASIALAVFATYSLRPPMTDKARRRLSDAEQAQQRLAEAGHKLRGRVKELEAALQKAQKRADQQASMAQRRTAEIQQLRARHAAVVDEETQHLQDMLKKDRKALLKTEQRLNDALASLKQKDKQLQELWARLRTAERDLWLNVRSERDRAAQYRDFAAARKAEAETRLAQEQLNAQRAEQEARQRELEQQVRICRQRAHYWHTRRGHVYTSAEKEHDEAMAAFWEGQAKQLEALLGYSVQ